MPKIYLHTPLLHLAHGTWSSISRHYSEKGVWKPRAFSVWISTTLSSPIFQRVEAWGSPYRTSYILLKWSGCLHCNLSISQMAVQNFNPSISREQKTFALRRAEHSNQLPTFLPAFNSHDLAQMMITISTWLNPLLLRWPCCHMRRAPCVPWCGFGGRECEKSILPGRFVFLTQ